MFWQIDVLCHLKSVPLPTWNMQLHCSRIFRLGKLLAKLYVFWIYNKYCIFETFFWTETEGKWKKNFFERWIDQIQGFSSPDLFFHLFADSGKREGHMYQRDKTFAILPDTFQKETMHSTLVSTASKLRLWVLNKCLRSIKIDVDQLRSSWLPVMF